MTDDTITIGVNRYEIEPFETTCGRHGATAAFFDSDKGILLEAAYAVGHTTSVALTDSKGIMAVFCLDKTATGAMAAFFADAANGKWPSSWPDGESRSVVLGSEIGSENG